VIATRILVVLHPWQPGREERDRLLSEAAALAGEVPVELLTFTGSGDPTAVAARLSTELAGTAQRQLVLLPTGTESEAIAAMVASRLDGVSLGRCSTLALSGDAIVARRAAFGGRVELTLRSEARITCATLRPQTANAHPATIVKETEVVMDEPAAYRVASLPSGSGLPRVEGASLVVAGGRGLDGTEGFGWLARIAAALGAGLGGSLPAVDAGWVPVAHQVGQSGKFVSPKVYFAVAISGTPQHLAGISSGARIVALNKDPEAAIFSRADVGVEGDWRELLPLLAQELESRQDS
jgi:electron transfer flavoprotein alpha subunit